MSELTDTLRSEARYRPTIWGDARPLLIEAANALDRLREFYDAYTALESSYNSFTGWSDHSSHGTAAGFAAAQARLTAAKDTIEASDAVRAA